MSRAGKSVETEKRSVVARGLGRGGVEWVKPRDYFRTVNEFCMILEDT